MSMNKILFVYNADSGLLNAMMDWGHKIISPETYQCSLCALTYDNLGMRRGWREFVNELEHEVEFLHRDELAEKYGLRDAPLPATFLVQDGQPQLWISTEEMNACNSLEALQALVTEKLKAVSTSSP
jgi:hypothetical protein